MSDVCLPVHVVIPTHIARHLMMVLFGLSRQRVKPASITVSADGINDELEAVVHEGAQRYGLDILYVRRERHKEGRVQQARNNGVRGLLQHIDNPSGRLLILDGDTVPLPQTIEMHGTLGYRHGLVVASRIMLDQERTAALDLAQLEAGTQVLEPTPEDLAEMARQHRKALTHQVLRRFSMTKAHKPKIIGAHFSIDLKLFITINGADEEYLEYGMNDDEIGRRSYLAGGNSIVAIKDIPVMHLYHPPRQATRWRDNPGFERFRRTDLPVYCVHGLDNPLPQNDLQIDLIRGTG
ncbi:MAG: hypothetical protein D8M59_16760 [Planctomycetes bacterium]|nr:hypothetical protein [Planctomycetota bacterium]NOG52841.1 hypothetical protein [Planctomycetota bacterium]